MLLRNGDCVRLLGCGNLASHSVRTAFSVKAPTGIRLLENRPFLVVSSTSWTGGCVSLLSLGFLFVSLIPFACDEREREWRMYCVLCRCTGMLKTKEAVKRLSIVLATCTS